MAILHALPPGSHDLLKARAFLPAALPSTPSQASRLRDARISGSVCGTRAFVSWEEGRGKGGETDLEAYRLQLCALPFGEGRESGQLLKGIWGPGALSDVGEVWAYLWVNVKKPVGRRG